ncbi:MAG: FAD-dependent oxidoreductase [Acidimicrobiia bacterium]|nr:FAD-dependent oxidoreductase [Acidimicrobiia bacterium]
MMLGRGGTGADVQQTMSRAEPAELATLIEAADRRTLAAVVTHLSGDPGAVPDLRDKAQIKALALEILPAFLRGERTVTTPGDEVLQAAMNLAVGAEVPAEYRTLVREQTGIGPVEPLAPLPVPDGFHVAIIGAGVTGVLAARTLDQLGVTNITVLEKNPEPGGTWWQNRYPGCRVDTPSLLYSFSFDQDPGWPEHFSRQPELLRYVKRIAEESELGARLRCGTEVEAMTWDEGAACWRLDLRHGDGSTSEMTANAVIAALGLLRVARYPDIPGREEFAGPALHSAHWDPDVDLHGKRVAVVGTGASANQIVPAIAPVAAQVTIYQRSPHWIISHPKYGKALAGVEKQLFDAIPTYREWNRFSESWKFGDGVTPMVRVDPDWPYPERSVNAASDKLRAQLMEYVTSQVGDRPDLLDKVVPNYPPYGKRMLVDNGWYEALRRDNVRLVTSPIRQVTADGVTTTAGHDEVDVLVFATGFQADRVLWPIQVTGAGGVDITARLEENPEAYLGISPQDGPNLFISPGPNGTPGHGGNGIFAAECHVRYIVECLRGLFEHGARSMEVREEVLRAYVEDLCAELETIVQSLPGFDNWYKGDRGRVTTIAPKSILQFWQDCRTPDPEAYAYR